MGSPLPPRRSWGLLLDNVSLVQLEHRSMLGKALQPLSTSKFLPEFIRPHLDLSHVAAVLGVESQNLYSPPKA